MGHDTTRMLQPGSGLNARSSLSQYLTFENAHPNLSRAQTARLQYIRNQERAPNEPDELEISTLACCLCSSSARKMHVRIILTVVEGSSDTWKTGQSIFQAKASTHILIRKRRRPFEIQPAVTFRGASGWESTAVASVESDGDSQHCAVTLADSLGGNQPHWIPTGTACTSGKTCALIVRDAKTLLFLYPYNPTKEIIHPVYVSQTQSV